MRYLLFLFFLIAVSGCSPEQKTQKTPERILSLSAAATKILYSLECPPVAIDEYGLITSGSPVPEVIGKGTLVSREKMADLRINCVILWYYQKEAAEDFRQNGLQVIELPPLRLEGYPALIQQLGELTGKQEKASELIREFQEKMHSLSTIKPGRKVYFELYGPMQSAGSQSYIGDLLSLSGGRLLLKKTGLTGTESLLAYQPEIIFYIEGYGSENEFRKRPGFSNLPAVKDCRIIAVPRHLITEGAAPLEAIRFFQKHLSEE